MKKIYTLFLGLILIGSAAKSQTIVAIQTPGSAADTSALFGTTVTTSGIVTATRSNGYWIQDGTGPYTGIFVLDNSNTPSRGDNVTVSATVDEYFNLTELKTVTSFTTNSTGNILPTPAALTTSGANDEQYEGVLVQVTSAQATALPNSFGEWDVNDGSGVILVDDAIFAFTPVLNNNYDVTGVLDYSYGAYKIQPRDAADIVGATGSTPLTSIYDIQFTTDPNGDSPQDGNVVKTRGVVTAYVSNTANFGAGSFFIQDGNGAWNGLYIYNQDTSLTPSVGDSVEVTGTVDEFNLGSAPQKVTELTSITDITVINSGNTLPTPTALSTGAANAEEYEGVLISVSNAEATAVGSTLGFGLWEMNDGSGALKGDDDMYAYHTQAVLGSRYNVTGVGHYSFDDYKILPRKMNDVSIFTGIDELSGIRVKVYPNPVKDVLFFKLGINGFNVKIVDVTGKTVKTANSLNNRLSIKTDNLKNGIYFYNITGLEGNLISTNKFIVAK